MRIQRGIVETMINLNSFPVSLSPSRIDHGTVSCSKDIRSNRSGKVHTFVKTADMIYRIDPPSVSGGHAFEVLVQNRLYGRNILHSGLLFFLQVNDLFIRSCLDVQFLLQNIHFSLQIRGELRIGHSCERVIIGDLLCSTQAHGHWNRFGSEQRTVEIVIPLREVCQHNLHLVYLGAQDFHLRRQVFVILNEGCLSRRGVKIEEGIEENHSKTDTPDKVTARAAKPITQAMLNTLQLQRLRINTVFL